MRFIKFDNHFLNPESIVRIEKSCNNDCCTYQYKIFFIDQTQIILESKEEPYIFLKKLGIVYGEWGL